MNDQAAGLRAWQARQQSRTTATSLEVLGEPTPEALRRKLAVLAAPDGQGWAPRRPGTTPARYRALWLDTARLDIAAAYRQLKQAHHPDAPTTVLLIVAGRPDARAQLVIANLIETTRRFLGLTLTPDEKRWQRDGAAHPKP